MDEPETYAKLADLLDVRDLVEDLMARMKIQEGILNEIVKMQQILMQLGHQQAGIIEKIAGQK